MGDNQSDNSWEEELERKRFEEQKNRLSLLRFFQYQHLPSNLQQISKPFHHLAEHMIDTLGVDVVMKDKQCAYGFQKLIEAKDCFVRAKLDRL